MLQTNWQSLKFLHQTKCCKIKIDAKICDVFYWDDCLHKLYLCQHLKEITIYILFEFKKNTHILIGNISTHLFWRQLLFQWFSKSYSFWIYPIVNCFCKCLNRWRSWFNYFINYLNMKLLYSTIVCKKIFKTSYELFVKT